MYRVWVRMNGVWVVRVETALASEAWMGWRLWLWDEFDAFVEFRKLNYRQGAFAETGITEPVAPSVGLRFPCYRDNLTKGFN